MRWHFGGCLTIQARRQTTHLTSDKKRTQSRAIKRPADSSFWRKRMDSSAVTFGGKRSETERYVISYSTYCNYLVASAIGT